MLFASDALGAVTFNGKAIEEPQVATIKGLIYERTTNGLPEDIKIQILPSLAKAIVWMEETYKVKKKYEITKIKTEEAELLTACMRHIVNLVLNNPHGLNNKDLDNTITRWYNLGKSVVASYEEETRYNKKTKKYEVHIDYVLKLKKDTQKLIYRVCGWGSECTQLDL
jgi:hypothetical protein